MFNHQQELVFAKRILGVVRLFFWADFVWLAILMFITAKGLADGDIKHVIVFGALSIPSIFSLHNNSSAIRHAKAKIFACTVVDESSQQRSQQAEEDCLRAIYKGMSTTNILYPIVMVVCAITMLVSGSYIFAVFYAALSLLFLRPKNKS